MLVDLGYVVERVTRIETRTVSLGMSAQSAISCIVQGQRDFGVSVNVRQVPWPPDGSGT
jgi:hypothetical protein